MSRPDEEWLRAQESLRRLRERRRVDGRRGWIAVTSKLLLLAVCVGGAVGLRGSGVAADGRSPDRVAVADPADAETADAADSKPATGERIAPADAHDGWLESGVGRSARVLPRRSDIRRARSFARRRSGLVAFAVIDTDGRLHGFRRRAPMPAASVVKAPLLVARLRDLEREGESPAPGERERLAAMIRWSDNDAADAVYATVGDHSLIETAQRGGMRGFTVAGHWGNAQHTAEGLVRFMSRMRRVLEAEHRRFAMDLMASIVPEQRWGIPEVVRSWEIWMKGGWTDTRRGELVSQAALLQRDGRRIALAILTDAQPSHGYGRETLKGIAARLLRSASKRT